MTATIVEKPGAGEYAPGFGKYIALIAEQDLATFLSRQAAELAALVGPLSESEARTIHPPYAWSIKQVVGHVNDCERVFGYRLLRLARLDRTPLPSFDEDAFMAAAHFDDVPVADLLAEFAALREANRRLVAHIPTAAWRHAGTVSDHAMTCRAMAYALAGHAEHHLQIMKRRLGR